MKRVVLSLVVALLLVETALAQIDKAATSPRPGQPVSSSVTSLDGDEWLLATDPQNVGREEKWWGGPRPDAKPTRVPWIIQEIFPGYHGVAWYWRDVKVLPNPHSQGRYVLRFWMVDYLADVWMNGTHIGTHEGGEDMFTLDVTDVVKPGEDNRIAVRVLNPTDKPIDGIVLNQTPRRNKTAPYTPGSDFNYGGITDCVELLITPAIRVEDLFVRPDPKTGVIRIRANLHNAGKSAAKAEILFTVAPASSGQTLQMAVIERELPDGDTLIETTLKVVDPRLWDLNNPYMYRVTARVSTEGSDSFGERSTRCGFRDFRFAGGAFRLNGRRIFLKGSHTGADSPIGVRVPPDPDMLRRDLLNVKVMGFNMIRFIAGVGRRYQLDLCDEIGLLVYEESFAGWLLGNSPHMTRRYNDSLFGMIRRDRNHPSVVIWGLLNETSDGPVFRHAVELLPELRKIDDSRMVMLNSGRWDRQDAGGTAGLQLWQNPDRTDPCVNLNSTKRVIEALGITWQPGQMAFHPGRNGEHAVVRWTAPDDGDLELSVAFNAISRTATTDVHVVHNGRPIFGGLINVGGQGPEARFEKTLPAKAGDTIDCIVGFGNGHYGADTTSLAITIKTASGKTHNAAVDFTTEKNPNGPWSYGQLAPGKPDVATFKLFPKGVTLRAIGSLSNPGSSEWEDVLADEHPYRRVPHTADIIQEFRTFDGNGKPLFISEYGVGSAVDLVRLARHYEQRGKTHCEDARAYRGFLDQFLADWERWRLDDTFAGPEDYFRKCLDKMADQRKLGINAIRSNPAVVGYSLTGTQDQGLTAEGLTTTFRELKPGTIDALFDAFYPLRWCLFVEPVNIYRGSTVRLEAVLANEDVLVSGEYPVRLQVVGPDGRRVFDRTIPLSIPKAEKKVTGTFCAKHPSGRSGKRCLSPFSEPPFAMPVFSEEVAVDGPSGKYRFLATFQRGGAASGGDVEFYVADRADMPPVEDEVVLWGKDDELTAWLEKHGFQTRPFVPGKQTAREVILVSGQPPENAAEAYGDLVRRIARGSTAIFLTPAVFKKADDTVGWLPLSDKGRLAPYRSWVYIKDEWAKEHAIFDGLPCGGLMDYTFYREIIPDLMWSAQEPPAEAVAGGINTSLGYVSGLLVSVHDLGAGRFFLNTLRIRDNLEKNPAAERLLRNMLRYAARDFDEPLADLPADFDSQLKAMGYQ
ncbi:MAG: glycoside hydrolase family 2 [Planctomycetes bacterium]|nr:glycoside hydrolase family 2 [Planctomycetota bacterium]